MLLPVGIALGSNLGNRSAELDAGIRYLRTLSEFDRLRESVRIETIPVNCPPGSGTFLNSVAEVQLDPKLLPPRELLQRLQAFERSRGRLEVRPVNAPRQLDLDIIYYGDLIVNEPDLVIPHPLAATRRFVLEPLAHLRPDLVLPGQAKTVCELLKQCR